MEMLTIEVINPRAKKLLEGLAELELISIRGKVDVFMDTVEELQEADADFSLEEIQAEVDAVRAERHAKKVSG